MSRLRIVPLLMFCLFAGTSVWFAPNAIAPVLGERFGLTPIDIKSMTASVQYGFLTGTALLTLTMAADRLPIRFLFLGATTLNAILTLSLLWVDYDSTGIAFTRFMTGLCLAAVYPICIKATASWYVGRKRGLMLGFIVGSLALGAAFPHMLNSLFPTIDIEYFLSLVAVASMTSGLCFALFFRPGPHQAKPSAFSFQSLMTLLENRRYVAIVIGFMGHMWELFTLWILIPKMWTEALTKPSSSTISILSLVSVGAGFVGCIIGGYYAFKKSSLKTTQISLLISGGFCLGAPILGHLPPHHFLYWFIIPIWGMAVIADSPQFSSMASSAVKPEQVGTAIACMTCLGYGVSAISIQLLIPMLDHHTAFDTAKWLAIGPMFALISLKLFNKSNT